MPVPETLLNQPLMSQQMQQVSGVAASRRILVVDDSEAIHHDFAKLLRGPAPPSKLDQLEDMLLATPTKGTAHKSPHSTSFDVDFASQGEQALEMVRQACAANQPYAMVFLDMVMPPGWDGLTTLQHIWQVDPRVEAVICSAYSSQHWTAALEAVGETDQMLFLNKPFDACEVVQLAHALTKKWMFRRAAERSISILDELVAERTAQYQQVAEQLARSLDKRKQMARNIQETLNPSPEPVLAGSIALAGFCQPSEECGGDWWSSLPLDGDRVLVTMGDVAGHGVGAAMLAAAARGSLGTLVEQDRALSPQTVLSSLDRVVRDIGRGDTWMTCIAVLIDPAHELITFSNAGHMPPLVIREDGTCRWLMNRGTPLGSTEPHHPEKQQPFARGDMLVVFTDGMIEHTSPAGIPLGEKRLRASLQRLWDTLPPTEPQLTPAERGLRNVHAIRDALLADVLDHGRGAAVTDDLTLVVCQHV